MKKVIGAICLVFMAAVIGLGYYYAADGGVTYRFDKVDTIENFTESKFTAKVGKVVKNDTEAEKVQKFEDLSTTTAYKCNVKLVQAEWRLIEKEIGTNFTKSYKNTISGEVNVPANNYAWAEFTPEMTKVTGYIVKTSGGKETKTYVEIVYPKADGENAGAAAGQVEFKTAAEKPAEKLS